MPNRRGSVDVKVYLRTVTPEQVASVRPRGRFRYLPLGFGLGTPPFFEEPYAAGFPSAGHYSRAIKGSKVAMSCKQADAAIVAINRRQVPQTPFTEIMVVLSADEKGAEVDGFFVDYTVGGKDYRREVPWDMVVCDRGRQLPGCGDETS